MSRLSDTWSRRRAGVRAEAEADRLAVEQAAIATAQAGHEAAHEDKSDADILRELSLQDPDQMQAGDDFAAFMRAEVPQRLRKRALRTLWRSNPVLACVDDLLDYGDDFKAGWNASGVISTTYQVGKGMLAHVQEMERQELADQADQTEMDAPDQFADAGPEVVPEVAEPEPELANLADSAPDQQQPVPQPDEESPQSGVMHRMRFEFDGAA